MPFFRHIRNDRVRNESPGPRAGRRMRKETAEAEIGAGDAGDNEGDGKKPRANSLAVGGTGRETAQW